MLRGSQHSKQAIPRIPDHTQHTAKYTKRKATKKYYTKSNFTQITLLTQKEKEPIIMKGIF